MAETIEERVSSLETIACMFNFIFTLAECVSPAEVTKQKIALLKQLAQLRELLSADIERATLIERENEEVC